MDIKIRDRKIDEGEFLKERKAVLSMWPTGKGGGSGGGH